MQTVRLFSGASGIIFSFFLFVKEWFLSLEPAGSMQPGLRNDSLFETWLDNPFHVEGLEEIGGPYSTMIEVPWIYRDAQKLINIEPFRQNYQLLISRLKQVDLRRLKHEETLAFWINIHNALVMLAYGIPQNNMRRTFQLLKAAYNVGGYSISADTMLGTILGRQMSRPCQWIRPIISPPNNLWATFGERKDKKILLPKIMELLAKGRFRTRPLNDALQLQL